MLIPHGQFCRVEYDRIEAEMQPVLESMLFPVAQPETEQFVLKQQRQIKEENRRLAEEQACPACRVE